MLRVAIGPKMSGKIRLRVTAAAVVAIVLASACSLDKAHEQAEHSQMTENRDQQKSPIKMSRRECEDKTYDEIERLISTEKDDYCDGIIDDCSLTYYDKDGRTAYVTRDLGCNGVVELCWLQQFDSRGNLISFQSCPVGAAVDYYFRLCAETTIDNSGRQIQTAFDFDCDGADVCYQSEVDSQNRPILALMDAGCNGTINACQHYTYGVEDRMRMDERCDGTVEMCSSTERLSERETILTLYDGDCPSEDGVIPPLEPFAPGFGQEGVWWTAPLY
ncbi:MAG: hypothetical protein M5R36_15630 [Deltaproteobacteria bacterium]|nr:hypothetical protein [Deltaproteobacteria bacterium]